MLSRIRRFFGASILLCWFGVAAAAANDHASSHPTAADAVRALARDPQWLRLLHVGKDGQRSEILSTDFFLSANGPADPEAELRATLHAMQAPVGIDPNVHGRCRFPARALWLSQQRMLPGQALPHTSCPRLADWARVDRLRSISLLLVSGYFGNPASSFGHSLLRFNTEDGRASDGLTDLGINFGALVPERESTLVYVFKGLLGGYEAGFSDKPYHAHDLIYSRTEFRDMWDHELALDDNERLMLAYHLWEIAGKKFTYYFLKENCAYRIAELLALVRNDDLLARSGVWFAPVEVFHRLQEAQQRSGRPWFHSVRFIPSAERVLRHQFAGLNADEARAANAVIAQAPAEAAGQLAAIAPERRIDVLDALMAYNNYRLAAEEPEVSPATKQARNVILRSRLQLPPRRPADNPIPPMRSPAEGSAPMLTAFGAGYDDRRGGFARVRWAPFSYELSGHNGLADGELVVLDTVVDIDGHGHIALDSTDVIRVKKLSATRTRIFGEGWLSWQVRLGARREQVAGIDPLRLIGSFGGGYAAPWGDAITAYAMVDGVALSKPSSIGAEPNAGIVVRAGHWKLWLQAGSRYESASRHWVPHHHGEATYRLSADRALRLEFTRRRDERAVLSLIQYW